MDRAIRQADVIHVHSFWNGFASIMIALARRAGKPVILSPRGTLHRQAMSQSSATTKAAFAAVVGQKQLAGVSGLHFQTETEAQSSFGTEGRPNVIIDNGVALPDTQTPREVLRRQVFGPTAEDLNLVFLGRVSRIKGIDLQIKLLRLLKDRGVTAFLHLVGPDEGELGHLQKFARNLNVHERLHAHGPIYSSAKHDWLRAADAVLMTSEFENNSNAALEAMAAGGALIGTEGTLADTWVQAGAAVCVPRQAEALAQFLQRPMDRALRTNARNYVNLHHSWEPRAERMLKFYENLL